MSSAASSCSPCWRCWPTPGCASRAGSATRSGGSSPTGDHRLAGRPGHDQHRRRDRIAADHRPAAAVHLGWGKRPRCRAGRGRRAGVVRPCRAGCGPGATRPSAGPVGAATLGATTTAAAVGWRGGVLRGGRRGSREAGRPAAGALGHRRIARSVATGRAGPAKRPGKRSVADDVPEEETTMAGTVYYGATAADATPRGAIGGARRRRHRRAHLPAAGLRRLPAPA